MDEYHDTVFYTNLKLLHDINIPSFNSSSVGGVGSYSLEIGMLSSVIVIVIGTKLVNTHLDAPISFLRIDSQLWHSQWGLRRLNDQNVR